MRIGVDIRFEGKVTGVEEYARQLFLALSGADNQNEYVFFQTGFREREDDFWSRLANDTGDFIHLSRPNKFLNLSLKAAKRPLFNKWMGSLDIFFMPNWNLFSVASDVKSVVVAHDLSFERFPHFFSIRRRFWHKFIAPRLRSKEVSHIIAPTASTKSDLIEIYGVNPKKISVIPWGIRPIFRYPLNDRNYLEQVKRKYSLPDQYIFSLATLEPRKNIMALIDAYCLLKKRKPGVEMVLAGMEGWLCKDIVAYAKKAGVHFLGFVDDLDKPALYSLASVFVYLSFFEGFGFPPLEAMASGVPTVVSSTSSFPENVESAAFMADPFYSEEIAWAIVQIMENENLRRKLRTKGLEQIKKFGWQKTAESTLNLWERLA